MSIVYYQRWITEYMNLIKSIQIIEISKYDFFDFKYIKKSDIGLKSNV